MIIAALVIAAAAAVGVVIAVFWKDMFAWLKRAFDVIKEKLNIVVSGTQVFLKRVLGGFQEESYHYSKVDTDTFRKDTVIKESIISEDDVPEEIREAARLAKLNQSIDITPNTESEMMKLQNS